MGGCSASQDGVRYEHAGFRFSNIVVPHHVLFDDYESLHWHSHSAAAYGWEIRRPLRRMSRPFTSTPTFTLESFEMFPSSIKGHRQTEVREALARGPHVKDFLTAFHLHPWRSIKAWSARRLRRKKKGCEMADMEGAAGLLRASSGATGNCSTSDSHPAGNVQSPAVKRPRAPSIMTYQVTPGPDEDGCVPTITLGDVFVLAPASSVEKLRATLFPMHNPFLFLARVEMQFWKSVFKEDMPGFVTPASLAHIFGDAAVQGGKLAFWVERRVAEAAAVAGLAADIVTEGKGNENISIPELEVRPLPEDPLNLGDEALTAPIPRIPTYLLPRSFAPPVLTSAEEEAQRASDVEHEEGLRKSAMHLLRKEGFRRLFGGKPGKSASESLRGLKVLTVPLAEAFSCIQDQPSWCRFADRPSEVKHLVREIENRAWSESEAPATLNGLTSDKDPRLQQSRESELAKSQEAPSAVPVYLVPSISITLPTSMGPVRFQPAFLSSDQLSVTWSAVRAMAKEWQILKRSRLRHRTRREIEAVGARIVGVEMRNEESSDHNLDDDGDPPETQEVLEELGEPGANRNKSGSHLVPRPGMIGLFGTVALGALVMAADVGEMLCSVGDHIAFSTPLGHQLLGALPPTINVETMPLASYIRSVDDHNASYLGGEKPKSKLLPLKLDRCQSDPREPAEDGPPDLVPGPAALEGQQGDWSGISEGPQDGAWDVDWREVNDGMVKGIHTILRSSLNAVIASVRLCSSFWMGLKSCGTEGVEGNMF
eukprot:jgi/Botrbrau1/12591/Bobra.0169s0119.2